MSKIKNPQEKKQKSLTKDRRRNHGECPTSSRKSVRTRKTHVNRSYRMNERIALKKDVEEIDDKVKTIEKKYFKKWRDIPLKEYLDKQGLMRDIHDS